jgi:hypothetical protein
MDSLYKNILLNIFDLIDAKKLTLLSASNKYFNKLCRDYTVRKMNVFQMYYATEQEYKPHYKFFTKIKNMDNAGGLLCDICKNIYADEDPSYYVQTCDICHISSCKKCNKRKEYSMTYDFSLGTSLCNKCIEFTKCDSCHLHYNKKTIKWFEIYEEMRCIKCSSLEN